MEISVRRAEERDWHDLRFIRLKALRSDPSVFGSNYEKESDMLETDWKRWLQPDDSAVFLLYDGSVPIGMTGIAVDREDATKKRAVLWGSWLEPRARGQGLSHVLYRRRIAWANAHLTVEQIVVSHRASNLASKNANQKHGFKHTHIRNKTWPDGTEDDKVFYVLNVKPASTS
jgi:RimJ/RimL family protein N-acetyltransferase